MKTFPLFVCFALLAISSAVHSDDAQESAANTPASAETEAGRVARIHKVIASDTARLAELRKDLEQRAARFERTSQNASEREADLVALRARLEGTSDPDEAAEIEKEVEAVKEKYELVKVLVDLSFQAERAVRGQVLTLERKIAIDQQALDELLSPTEVPQITTPPAGVPAPYQPATQAPSQPMTIPGVPGMPGAPTQPEHDPQRGSGNSS